MSKNMEIIELIKKDKELMALSPKQSQERYQEWCQVRSALNWQLDRLPLTGSLGRSKVIELLLSGELNLDTTETETLPPLPPLDGVKAEPAPLFLPPLPPLPDHDDEEVEAAARRDERRRKRQAQLLADCAAQEAIDNNRMAAL